MKLSQAIREVIRLSSEIAAYWDAELPKRHPNYPVIGLFEDSGPPPPQELELREFLKALPPESVYKMLLVTYLGRGDYETNDLAEQLQYLKVTFDDAEAAASQMMEKGGLLARYLQEGLVALDRAGIDIDNFLSKTAAKVRKAR